MTSKPDTINIPAYLRKRSINAKARKKPTTNRSSSITSNSRTNTSTTTRKIRYSSRNNPTIEEISLLAEIDRDELFPAPIEPPAAKLKKVREMMACGICEGYFEKIDVAIIRLTSPLREGDRIIFEKQNGLFEQSVESMQIDRKDVKLAKTGSDIGMKVAFKPTVGTQVYKVIN